MIYNDFILNFFRIFWVHFVFFNSDYIPRLNIEVLSNFFPLLKFGHIQSSQHNLEITGFDNDTACVFWGARDWRTSWDRADVFVSRSFWCIPILHDFPQSLKLWTFEIFMVSYKSEFLSLFDVKNPQVFLFDLFH